MQKLSDVLGRTQGRTGEGPVSSATVEKEDWATTPARHEEAVYIVTILVPIAAAAVDEGMLIIRTEVLARSETQAVYKAGVSAKRG